MQSIDEAHKKESQSLYWREHPLLTDPTLPDEVNAKRLEDYQKQLDALK
jgi:hypothetical protein